VVVLEPPLQTLLSVAVTVNVEVPAGVVLEVLMVKSEVCGEPLVLVTMVGLNVAVAPLGSPDATLRVTPQLGVVPLKLTWTEFEALLPYVAELPAATGFGV